MASNRDVPLMAALGALVIASCTSTAPPAPKGEECDGVWQSGDTDRVCVPAPPTGGATGNGGASMGGMAGVIPDIGTGGTGGTIPDIGTGGTGGGAVGGTGVGATAGSGAVAGDGSGAVAGMGMGGTDATGGTVATGGVGGSSTPTTLGTIIV